MNHIANFKSPPVRDDGYLKSLRREHCLVTHRQGHGEVETVDPAHFRWGTDGGASSKPSDWFAIPLIHSEHAKQHQIGEKTYWLTAVNENPEVLGEFIRDALRWRYFEKTGEAPTK